MAQVTVSPAPTRHVWGDLVTRFYVVSGAQGDTLNTGQQVILFADPQAFNLAGTTSVITAMVYNATTGVITFTTTNGAAAMVNEVIMVISRKG